MRADKLRGFSLMEMMVVLLIVAIVAAASAPMVSKKMSRSAGTNDSPWVFTGLNDTVAFNPGGRNVSSIIGANRVPGGETPRFYIQASNDIPHISFGRDNVNDIISLIVDMENNRIGLSNEDVPDNSVIIGTDQFVGNNNPTDIVAIGIETVSAAGSIAVGHNTMSENINAITIGRNVRATGAQSIAIGSITQPVPDWITSAGADFAIALGSSARANGANSIAIGGSNPNGNLTTAGAADSIAMGSMARATAANSISIGRNSSSAEQSSIVIGNGAQITNANSNGGISIGNGARNTAMRSIAIGPGATINFNANIGSSMAIGQEATVTSALATAIGNRARASQTSALALGSSTVASGLNSTALGVSSTASGGQATALGNDSTASGFFSTALGSGATSSGHSSLALGRDSSATAQDAVAIGRGAQAASRETIVLGTGDYTTRIPGELNVTGEATFNHNVYATAITMDDVVIGGNNSDHSIEVFGSLLKMSDLTVRGNFMSDLKMYGVIRPMVDGVLEVDGRIAHRGLLEFSDRRLKNVGKKYVAGLDELKKLDFYHYTFKKDEEKTPRVGVMAQDLQKVFPNAVTKDKDGYLTIRMEDMFYAVINAVKELDRRICAIVNDIVSINKKLEAQQKIIDKQQKLLEEQQAAIEELRKEIRALK